MAVNEMGLSTLGIEFGYAVGSTKPSSFTKLDRIVSIGEAAITNETIDVSCLEDLTSKFVRGRGTVTDSIPVVVNWTDEVEQEWDAVLTAYNSRTTGQTMWWMIKVPGKSKCAFFKAQPPTALPIPSLDQNASLQNTMNLVMEELVGWDTAVSFLEPNLDALTLGSETLTPTFDEDVTEYTANITDASTSLTVTAENTGDTVEIFLNGTSKGSGTTTLTKSLTWTANTDEVEVKVTHVASVKTYKITVTHTV